MRETHTTGFYYPAHASYDGLTIHVAAAPKKGESLLEVSAERYGSGWVASQTCEFDEMVSHGGSTEGFGSDVVFLPRYGIGIIVFINVNPARDPLRDQVLRALMRTGGLTKRTLKLSPALDTATNKYLAIQNTWNEVEYAAMLSKGRNLVPGEREELAAYKNLHGLCKGFTPIEVEGPFAASLKVDCERGSFELRIRLGLDGGIVGFSGTSRDLLVEPRLKVVANRIVGLIGRWDDKTYQKHLAAKATKSRGEVIEEIEALRWMHGACTLKSAMEVASTRKLVVECERGGDLLLALQTDPESADTVTAYSFQRAEQGMCPVR